MGPPGALSLTLLGAGPRPGVAAPCCELARHAGQRRRALSRRWVPLSHLSASCRSVHVRDRLASRHRPPGFGIRDPPERKMAERCSVQGRFGRSRRGSREGGSVACAPARPRTRCRLPVVSRPRHQNLEPRRRSALREMIRSAEAMGRTAHELLLDGIALGLRTRLMKI